MLPSSVHLPVIPPSDLSSKVSKYPLLTSLGIETNFDTEKNEQKIQNLLSELVALHKNNNKNLNFSHLGNSHPGVAVSIPRAKNYDTYEKK